METHNFFGFRIVCARSVVLLVLCCSMAGCAQYRITVPDSDPTDIQYRDARMHAYLWGSIMSPLVESAECEGEGINDVIVIDHLGYDLISVLTLGIWKPISVRYRCHAPGASGSVVPFPEQTN